MVSIPSGLARMAPSHSATYKPSPLSFGSPRTSPFRRPESPVSPSTTIRPSTPTHASARPQTPSRLKDASTPELVAVGQWTPRRQNLQPFEGREAPVSPSRKQRINGDAEIILESGMGLETTVESTRTKYSGEGGSDRDPSRYTAAPSQKMSGDTISKLLQGQVREMREAFQILDRDSDGQVNRDDVVDMLGNLGLDTSAASWAPFFPPSVPATLSLPTYLSTISGLLAPLSPQSELLAAFSAFDDDDSGQIDASELHDALIHTSPDIGESPLSGREIDAVLDGWVGRRAFGKGLTAGSIKTKGEVFRYRDWIANLGSIGDGAKEGEVSS